MRQELSLCDQMKAAVVVDVQQSGLWSHRCGALGLQRRIHAPEKGR